LEEVVVVVVVVVEVEIEVEVGAVAVAEMDVWLLQIKNNLVHAPAATLEHEENKEKTKKKQTNN
jgi:hypothetical protein